MNPLLDNRKEIVATELSVEDSALLSQLLPEWKIQTTEGTLDTWHGDCESVTVLSVMVHSPIRAGEFDRFPNLRLVAARSTGYDHIDLVEAKRRNIVVSNVPAYGSNTVAEHTFALILVLARRIHLAYERTIRGQFALEGLMGADLAGKTIGVVGAGKIGQHVIRIARGFGMNVIATDPAEDQNLAELLSFAYVPLPALLHRADVIAVCCPLNDSTRGMFNRAAFEQMKPGVIFVNTARGGVVDSGDLLWALGEGIVGWAGLDVLEGEALMDEDRLLAGVHHGKESEMRDIAENLILMRHPKVVVTPHMAFYSREAVNRILETTAANIRAFDAGSPIHVVTA